MKNKVQIEVMAPQQHQHKEVSNVFVKVNGTVTGRYVTRSPYKLVNLLIDEDFENDEVTVIGL